MNAVGRSAPVLLRARCPSKEVRFSVDLFAHCVRDDRDLERWGSVSCFLTVRERKAIGCIFMNTYTRTLLRLNSAVAQAASKREGRVWT